jgi:hypothetical protein
MTNGLGAISKKKKKTVSRVFNIFLSGVFKCLKLPQEESLSSRLIWSK